MFQLLFLLISFVLYTGVSGETKKPFSEWGYYRKANVSEPYYASFSTAFHTYERSDKYPKAKCKEDTGNNIKADLSYYYSSYKDTNRILYVYFCQDPSRGSFNGYEYLEAKRLTSSAPFSEPVKLGYSLRDFGITGERDFKKTYMSNEQAHRYISPIFEGILKQMPKDDECSGNYSLQTEPNLHEKYENELNYYEFHVACLNGTFIPMKYVSVTVVQDKKYGYYESGQPILLSTKPPKENKEWLDKYSTATSVELTVTTMILCLLARAINL